MASLAAKPAADQRLGQRPPRARGPVRVQCGLGFFGKPHGSNDKPKTQAVSAPEVVRSQEEAAAPQEAPAGAAGLPHNFAKLADRLLMNAASLREPRGVTHCLKCRGMGTCECKACKGKGVLAQGKAKSHAVRRMVGRLEEMVGVASPSMHDSDWAVTNRCTRCRGSGRCVCPVCSGSGQRGSPLGPVALKKGAK